MDILEQRPMPMSASPSTVAWVVSADATQLGALCSLVRTTGLTPLPFGGAEAALAALNPLLPPALIVTSLCMPGLDGWRFCRLLRSPEYAVCNEVPIIVVAANFSGDYSERIAFDVGADAFLPSPVDGKDFVARVQALLRGKEMHRQPAVLIVEGDPDLSGALVEAFTARGYRADRSLTAREAESAFAQAAYDLAVLDNQLPGSAGDPLLDTFRVQQPNCVCIMVAADPTPELALNWLKRGAAAYLRKPFEPDRLIELYAQAHRERALLLAEDVLEAHTRELRAVSNRAEAALQQSESRYKAFFAQGLDGVVILDTESGRIIEFNDQACHQLGYTREEFARLRVADIEVSESPEELARHIRKVQAEGIDHFDTRQRTKRGEIRDVHVTAQIVEAAQSSIYLCIWRDITERKRAEEGVREYQKRLADIIQFLPDATLAIDRDKRVIVWNKAIEEMTDIPASEIIGQGDYAYTVPFYGHRRPQLMDLVFEDSTEIAARYPKITRQGDTLTAEFFCNALYSNQGAWIFAKAAPLYDASGKIIGAIESIRDITERKRAEEELARATALLQAAIEQTPAGMLIADAPDVRIRLANPAALGIRGESAETLTGIPVEMHPRCWLTCRPDGTPMAPEDLPLSRAILKGETVKNEELIIRRRDGESRHVLANAAPVRNAKGEVVAGVVVFPDVTELRRSEEAARRTVARRQRESEAVVTVAASANLTEGAVRELAAELTETAARACEVERVGVWLFEAGETRLVSLDNYSASTGEHSSGAVLLEHEFRHEFETFKTTKYVDAHDALTDPRTAGYVESYLKPNGIRSMLDAIIRSGGRNLGVLCFEHVDRPHHWEDDEITFACQLADQVALVVAHRERKRAEAEKEKLQAQLIQAQKMESVGRLAGGVAHDFNNMLQAILGNTALALEQFPAGSPAQEFLEEVQKSAQRSADLTRQLLTFARKQTIAPKVLDLNEIVEGMLKMLRRLIGEDIDLTWRPAANLGLVNMDPSQVDQVLANLCVNARDAIGGVGKVTIATENVVCDDAYLSEHPEGQAGAHVRLAVSDNGCGMSPEVRAHLFEPFFTTKGIGQGTGLGLATVYGIVKQNHGFINVYSEPGQGTTFQIHLPSHGIPTTAPTGKAPTPAPVRGNETILLVEDEPSILRVSQRLLENLGYRVLTAGTPGEAIRLAREHGGAIHLLMTDVVMPEMNGRDLAKNLLNYCPTLKRLFMSGYTADVIAHHGVLDPGVHFIQKPFSTHALAEKVREALGA